MAQKKGLGPPTFCCGRERSSTGAKCLRNTRPQGGCKNPRFWLPDYAKFFQKKIKKKHYAIFFANSVRTEDPNPVKSCLRPSYKKNIFKIIFFIFTTQHKKFFFNYRSGDKIFFNVLVVVTDMTPILRELKKWWFFIDWKSLQLPWKNDLEKTTKKHEKRENRLPYIPQYIDFPALEPKRQKNTIFGPRRKFWFFCDFFMSFFNRFFSCFFVEKSKKEFRRWAFLPWASSTG